LVIIKPVTTSVWLSVQSAFAPQSSVAIAMVCASANAALFKLKYYGTFFY